ncbi:MAG: YhdP family protein [Pseudomonadota bacterium]
MKQFFSRFYHFIWYFLASIIILAAIIVTAIRLSLPGIGSYKNEIQSWLSEYMDYPVVIGDITADWSGWNPNLQFHEVKLLSKENNDVVASFDEVSTGINLISSVTHYQVIPDHLTVSGLALSVIKKSDGTITINNLDGNNQAITGTNELAEWLINQRHLILQNVSVSWLDQTNNDLKKQFEDVELSIKAAGDRRQLNADIKLPDTVGQYLSINMDIFGNPLAPGWSGELYVAASGIKGNELFKKMPLHSPSGTADIILWTKWNKSKLNEVFLSANMFGVVLDNQGQQLLVDSADIKMIAGRKHDKQWLANLELTNVKTENGIWPESKHQLDILLDENNKINSVDGVISFLRLEDIASLIKFEQLIPAAWQTQVDWQTLSGDLSNVEVYNFQFSELSRFNFSSDFSGFALASIDASHSANKLNGKINFKDNQVKLDLQTENTDVRLGSLFEKNLSVKSLDGAASFSIINSEINIHEFSFICNQIPITIDGSLYLQDNFPRLDLITRIDETDLENIPSFLPRQTNPKLRQWINEAFIGGKVLSGYALFRGKLDEYPFADEQGTFQAILNVANANLNYNNGWPYVDNLTADIMINNDDLNIESSSGYIFDATIESLNAEINDLVKGDHHLIVDAVLEGQISDAIRFINESPLKQNDALYEFANRNVTGKFDLDIALDIPFGEEKSTVDGNIVLMNTMLDTNIPGIGLENINGAINFTRHKAWSSDIKALYQGKPVTVKIPMEENIDGDSQTIVSGRVDRLFIIQQLSSFFPFLLSDYSNYFQSFDGETDISVIIDQQRDENDALQRNITIESDLKGIGIALPIPFTKFEDESKPLRITTKLKQSKINNIEIDYSDFFSLDMSIKNTDDFSVDNILINIGNDINAQSSANTLISGQIPNINLDDWIHFIKQHDSDNNEENENSMAIELHAEKMILMENEFDNTKLVFIDTVEGWEAKIHGENIKGKADFIHATNTTNDQLRANFDYLYLINPVDKEHQQNKINIENFPELEISIGDLIYQHIKLGNSIITSKNKDDAVLFDKISFSRPDKMQISATGKWEIINGINRTNFDINLAATELAGLLDSFSFDNANIDGGDTNMIMNANWMDTPMSFQMSKLQGELDIDIKKGQLLDVDPSAGRIFGLLSITTLPRRLTLDFSDLFNKGYAFDSINGNFSIQDGQAYTNDLFMNAPAADIAISGRTGLINEDYDQVATVMPKVTSSLPVASALFGPIGVGVGTAIYLAGEVFESIMPININKILSKQYTIRGSWDDPQIEQLENANPSS